MPEGNALAVDERLADELAFPDKLAALMRAKCGSVGAWALSHRRHPQEVSYMLKAQRPYPEIRDLVAEDFSIPRDEIDRLLPLPGASSAEAAA
jgi:hypothetical protein